MRLSQRFGVTVRWIASSVNLRRYFLPLRDIKASPENLAAILSCTLTLLPLTFSSAPNPLPTSIPSHRLHLSPNPLLHLSPNPQHLPFAPVSSLDLIHGWSRERQRNHGAMDEEEEELDVEE
jgi:hypothetical protein